ncbi:hypothetical protein PAMP_003946 [Pampus punctatissimus]
MDIVVIKGRLMTWQPEGEMRDWLYVKLADFAVWSFPELYNQGSASVCGWTGELSKTEGIEGEIIKTDDLNMTRIIHLQQLAVTLALL